MINLAIGAPNFNAVLEPIMVSHLLVGRAIKGVTDREGFSSAHWPEADVGSLEGVPPRDHGVA